MVVKSQTDDGSGHSTLQTAGVLQSIPFPNSEVEELLAISQKDLAGNFTISKISKRNTLNPLQPIFAHSVFITHNRVPSPIPKLTFNKSPKIGFCTSSCKNNREFKAYGILGFSVVGECYCARNKQLEQNNILYQQELELAPPKTTSNSLDLK